jgi:PAS domain-containing protein
MEHLSEAIYYKDVQSKFVFVNSIQTYLFDSQPDIIIGRSEYDFLEPDIARPLFDFDKDIMNTGRVVHDEKQVVQYPSGVHCNVKVTKIPHFDEFGNIIGLLSISRIIDDKIQQY